MKKRKVPMRLCTGCRESKPKKELLRIVKSPDGEVSVDETGRKPGRGAYICRNAECLDKARKNRSLERTFEMKISEEVYEELEKEILSAEEVK
ncbi:MAG: RNase P modulator RnpM [Oscillospiraceae bacterium]|jgi:predicted RNA-binding protein YlxR (DUF448 family)